MNYPNCLPVNVYSGEIHGVTVTWSPSAKDRLPGDAGVNRVTTGTLKALSEHHLYMCATKFGSTKVTVQGAPHRFTTNSKTGDRRPDPDHISGRLSGGQNGRAGIGQQTVHLYLGGHGKNETKYDNVHVVGEQVMQLHKNGVFLRKDLSSGSFPLSGASMDVQASSSSYTAASSISNQPIGWVLQQPRLDTP